jgi:hypothetical protein
MPNHLQPVEGQYGNLTVLDRGRSPKGTAQWLCLCKCGKKVYVEGHDLRGGRRTSCGCSQNYFRLRPYESLYNWLVDHGTRCGKSVELTYEDFLEFTRTPVCHYCGDSVEFSEYSLGVNGNAYNLDRVDSNKGYTSDNCVVCCGPCNTMKSDLGVLEFFNRVGKIMVHQVTLSRRVEECANTTSKVSKPAPFWGL